MLGRCFVYFWVGNLGLFPGFEIAVSFRFRDIHYPNLTHPKPNWRNCSPTGGKRISISVRPYPSWNATDPRLQPSWKLGWEWTLGWKFFCVFWGGLEQMGFLALKMFGFWVKSKQRLEGGCLCFSSFRVKKAAGLWGKYLWSQPVLGRFMPSTFPWRLVLLG